MAQPSPPTLISPENDARTNDNLPFFTWENLAENILKYRLVVDNDVNFADGDNFYDNLNLTDNWDNFKTHTENALPEGTWYWKVQAENAGGWGPFSETRFFTVDVTPPQVAWITPSTTLITDATVAFNVGVQFNESMDFSGITFSFTPDVSDTLTPGGFSTDDNIYYNVYTVTDANNEYYGVDVTVSGARDLAGNLMSQTTAENAFDIDMKNPTVSSVNVSHPVINGDNVGEIFTVTVVYNDLMNEAIDPDIEFFPSVASTLTAGIGSWSDNLTFVKNYGISDANVEVTGVDILVENARDDNNNIQDNFQDNDKFDIDTKNPTIVSVTVDDNLIADNDISGPLFKVTITFDQDINADAGFPDIQFIPDVSDTLSHNSTGLGPDNLTIVSDYHIHDWGIQIAGVDILIENAWDENNNIMFSHLENDVFDIDTLNPTVASATASPDPANAGIVTITVVFSENMDNGVSPTVQVTGIISSPHTVTETSYVGDTWTGTFKLHDYNEIATGTISVSGAEDLAGNVMTADPTAGTFGVDTVAPTPRGPISILNNDFFNYDNGVNGGGSGTELDPWIIENFLIDASSADGIWIEHTTDYFVIRNCVIENGIGANWYGIYLDNVINGTIEGNTLSNNDYGICPVNISSNINLDNNTCNNNNYGVYLFSANGITISNNTCDGNSTSGIQVEDSYDCTIENNTCEGNSSGIHLEYSMYNTLDNNTCSNNSDDGIFLYYSNSNTLDNNTCSNNSDDGIFLYYSNSNTLDNNTCENNDYGIFLYYSNSNTLDNNTCENNTDTGIYLDYSIAGEPLWDYETGDYVYSVAISSDGSYIAAGSDDYYVYLFDNEGDLLWDYETGGDVNSVAISSDGSYIAAGSDDYYVYLFDNEGDLLWDYETGGYVYSVAISSDGSYIAAGSDDYYVYLFSNAGNLLWEYETGDYVYSVAISSDGSYIAAGSDDYYVYLFTSVGNTLSNNNCSNNNYGIYLYYTVNNTLDNNTCNNNGDGISLEDSHSNNIENNTCEGNVCGIYLYYSDYNTLLINTIIGNDYGFYVLDSDYNWIENNTILATSQYNFGSCPFLYTWDGTEMKFFGDINGPGGLGYRMDMRISGGGAQDLRPPTSTDYTAIDGSDLVPKDGSYILEVAEDSDEITYFDNVELWVIDHEPGVEIYSPEAAFNTQTPYLHPPIIHTVRNPVSPVSATDWNGNDILSVIASPDGIYTQAEPLTDSFITLDLGDLSGASQIKLIYRAYTDWLPIGSVKANQYVEVKNASGEWELVSEDEHFGKPEAMPRTYAVDITDWFKTDDWHLRLHTGTCKIFVDWIAVDTSVDEPVTVTVLKPTSANHYYKGPDHPEFEYFFGNFTKYGDVLPLLQDADDKFVIMRVGDSVELKFAEQPAPAGERDFLLVTDAYFKQPFVKYLLGSKISTVDPLPFHGMSNYPYPASESYPSDAEHLAYLSEWNTREYIGGEGAGISLPLSDNNTVIGNTIIGDPSCVGLILISETNTRILNNTISETGDAILVNDSWNCTISNNTVENNFGDGIGLGGSEDCLIENNTCSNNDDGIQVSDCGYIGLINNTCSNNSDDGIYIYWSWEFVVDNNTCENNYYGIYVDESGYIDLINNNCSNNDDDGIYIYWSEDCNIYNNTCENNSGDGIYLYISDYVNLTNNTCENNYHGIYLNESCDYNILDNNTCENNYYGIYVYSTFGNLTNNTCSNNSYGIYLSFSSQCIISKNYLLNNTDNNACDTGYFINYWDENGRGNYWSDWQPPEHPDNDGDGIVDEARLIMGGTIQDDYPLVLPDFSISVSPTSGSVQAGGSTTATVSLTPVPTVENFSVSLTASGQPSGVSVSFSPSSGVLPSSSTMTINVGSNVPGGTYTITVKGTCVADRERTSIFTLKVSAILPSGYSTGAGTISPAAPVTVQIQNSPITSLQINVNSTVQNVNVTVTQSTSTPSGIAIGAPGATYSYLDITVQNLSDANIDYVVISFKVEKSWLNANGIDLTTVALYRYSGGVWAALPTEIVSEDATYVYYSARSPGLSAFSISGFAKVTPTPPAPAPPPPSPGPLPEPSPTAGGAAPLGIEFWLVILGGAVAIVIALLGVIWSKKLKL